MNVLYISYDGLTDTLGRSQVLPYLCGLSDKGYQITVLSCDKPNIYKLENEKVKQITEANNILWYSVPYSKKYPIISALHNMRNMKRMAIKLCKENHYQLVHCRSYMAGSIGLDLKRQFHVKFIFDMRGFFADERVDGHVWNRQKLIYNSVYKYFKYKEKQLQSQADYIVSLTNAGKKVMIEQMHVTTPIGVIPCCADLHHFSMQNVHEEEKEQLKKELKINDDDFVISYVGSFGTWYMFSEMMDFVSVLMQKRAHVKFLILTPDDRQQIITAAAKYGIKEDNLVIKRVSREQMPLHIALSDISIFFIQPVFSKKASSPTKMGELLGMGIPLIVNAGVGDVDEIVADTHCGIVVKEFNHENYAKAIDQIDALLTMDKVLLIQAAQKYYSLEWGVDKYNKIYNLLNN